jgi:rfaE bifunctional protein kinase chain/domain
MSERARVLVVGDSMLDCYWDGSVERISPEAPVPVLRLGREWHRAGGAANVAVNLAALEIDATLVTLLGDDEAGQRLAALLDERAVTLHALRSPGSVTTQKIRAVCRQHQLLRVDIERPAAAQECPALISLVTDALPPHRWVLLSDYAKGALADCGPLLRRIAERGARAIVDPKGDDFERYSGAWMIKPNENEARAAVGGWHDEGDFQQRMTALRDRLGVEHLLVTRSERGMVLFSAQRTPLHVRSAAREVFDLAGAGDTVLAALAAALAEGQTLDDALVFANQAAGIVVGKFGTASVSRAEIEHERSHMVMQ